MYTTPGQNPDMLTEAQLQAWNTYLSSIFVDQIDQARGEFIPPSDRAWIYNPVTNSGGTTVEAPIDWTAFPKRIRTQHNLPNEAWLKADVNRDLQEEYCEWEIARDSNDRIIKLTVSCETADYYEFLAQTAPDKLLALYRQYVSPDVKLDDLFSGGAYVPQNKWNYPQLSGRHGAFMHMAQINNSFAAAVNLSAIASWPRIDGAGQLITGEQDLIQCRQFGNRDRHSDPHIGAGINALVRQGNEVSFADPVGLYIHLIDTQGWEFPGGTSSSKQWIRVERGTEAYPLRIVFEAPKDSPHVLGDLKIAGDLFEYGGQILDRIKIRITGIARPADHPAPAITCPGAAVTSHSLFSNKGLSTSLSKGASRLSAPMVQPPIE